MKVGMEVEVHVQESVEKLCGSEGNREGTRLTFRGGNYRILYTLNQRDDKYG